MKTLQVELGERRYPILIGPGLLDRSDLLQAHIAGSDILLVSNTIVAPLYASRLALGLGSRRVVQAILPDGESYKSLSTVSRVLDVLVANRFGRDCTVIGLGGGVVGDMAGFAAACYQRGVRFVQVPTTLLAQVDSSVGGKTGVNHPGGKNLIGAFHQPAAVITDTATLATLPARELRAGLAEVIKCALIRDAGLFGWLEENIGALLEGDPEALAYAIHRSCGIKAEIVARDEKEQGDRALLNLGHTFGHAIEAATQYKTWLHGEAVGAGLMMAVAMSGESGLVCTDDVARVRSLLERTGLPTSARDVSAESALEHMRIDKKVKSGRIRLVLLRAIGAAFITSEYADAALQSTLRTYFAR